MVPGACVSSSEAEFDLVVALFVLWVPLVLVWESLWRVLLVVVLFRVPLQIKLLLILMLTCWDYKFTMLGR